MLATQLERDEFREFCLNATDAQLDMIVKLERRAAEDGNDFRCVCLGIAETVRLHRENQ